MKNLLKKESKTNIEKFLDGFYWIKSNIDPSVFFLKDKNNDTYIVAYVKNGVLTGIYGRENAKPEKKFHKYILQFLLDNVNKIDINDEGTGFDVFDLSKEEYHKLKNEKPEIFKNIPYEFASFVK